MTEITITDVRHNPGDSAFLVDDGKTAVLYDTGFAFTGNNVANNIKRILGERPLDYIFLTHSHYDHAAGSPYICRMWKNAKVVAGEYAAKVFSKASAKTLMRELDRKCALACGVSEYEDLIDELHADITVCDGDVIRAGDMEFVAVALPGHTRCSFGFYLPRHKLLLGSETTGVFNAKDDVVPSYLVGYEMTVKSIEKVEALEVENILLPHFGLVDKQTTHFYLSRAKSSAVETASEIAGLIKKGAEEKDIVSFMAHKFYHGYMKTIYPIDAFELNTSIMISLIKKEFEL